MKDLRIRKVEPHCVKTTDLNISSLFECSCIDASQIFAAMVTSACMLDSLVVGRGDVTKYKVESQ